MLIKKWVEKVLTGINYYYKTISVFHHPAKNVVQPGYLVSFNESETDFLRLAGNSFHYQVDYSLGFRQKEVFIVPLADVTFLGNSGAIILKDKLITESVFDTQRLVKSPAFKTPRLSLLRKKTGLFTSILHLPWAEQSNYHWFLDCLPRLHYLLETVQEPIKIIVSDRMPAFQQETLNFLIKDKPNFSTLAINKHEKWRLTNFIFPSFASNHNSGYLPTAFLQKIRREIWAGYKVQDYLGKTRLFISRRKASKRRILNEEALMEVMKPYGFQLVFAEDLTYQQQVQLFFNAELVVSAHGAGLTNVLFCKSCKVWEIHPANEVKSHYFMLSKALGFEYFYTIGSEADGNLDFTVDEEAFGQKLQAFLLP